MNSELTQQLSDLRLSTMIRSLTLQEAQAHLYSELSFHERLSLLLGEEITSREQRKIDSLVKQAKFRLTDHPSQIDYRSSRGIEKPAIRSLLEGHWLTHLRNNMKPIAKWHELIEEATYADAIMDRVIHRAERFELQGESMRKSAINLTKLQ
jgi:DNA replication protein DnaC